VGLRRTNSDQAGLGRTGQPQCQAPRRQACLPCVTLFFLADLPADRILLLVQRLLLLRGDVRVVLAGHVALFSANLMILVVQGSRLLPIDLTVLHLGINALILIVEPAIDLGPAWVSCLKLINGRRLGACVRRRGIGESMISPEVGGLTGRF